MDEIIAVTSKDGKVFARVNKEPLHSKSMCIAGLLVVQHADEDVIVLEMNLPFDEMPLDVEMVAKSLVYWLYCECIRVPDEVSGTSDDMMGSYGFLCKLWVIAEKWQLQALGNDVIDAIIDLYLVNEYFPYSIIEFVYRETSKKRSGIRRLFVSIVEIGLSTHEPHGLENVMPTGFIDDLNRTMSEEQDNAYSGLIDKVKVCQFFHEHDMDGELYLDCVGTRAFE
jgi:hypothetical protein